MTRRSSILILAACVAVSLFCVIYPVYVIWPFRAQGARELMVALAVLRFRSAATVLSALAALAALVFYWRAQPVWWRRGLATVAAGFVGLLAAAARVNIYELMFHPDTRPSFQASAKVKLDGDERVIAVKVGGVARAYPIRNISYHHVINDVLGKAAIVATY
jgi:uncharacterized protein DUF3179